MTKYDFEFRLAVVKAYLAGEGGYQAIANKFNMPARKTIQSWVHLYRTSGETGLKPRINKRSYSVQFKHDVLQYKLRTGESFQDVALKFGIHQASVVSNWMRVLRKSGFKGLCKQKERLPMSENNQQPAKNKESLTEVRRLERENELLRAEVAYLKKLRASGINIPNRMRK